MNLISLLPHSTSSFSAFRSGGAREAIWAGADAPGVFPSPGAWVYDTLLPVEGLHGFMLVVMIIGALMVFVYGMRTMSEGIQAGVGSGLRGALESMTKNRWMGALSGLSVTSVLQSSTAVTVMTVSFVNAGLITVGQSAGIILGSNIGTTVTAWLVSLLGFRAGLTPYALVMFAIVSPLLLMRRSKVRIWRTPIIGLALMFIGLGFLMALVPGGAQAPGLYNFFLSREMGGYSGILSLVALGFLIAALLQSSSAAIALTMTFAFAGILPLTGAAALVLGHNIGTTVTAEFASLGGNVHAKRSARIHTIFNVLGGVWMVVALPYVVDVGWDLFGVGKEATAWEEGAAATTVLAAFHTFFNLANFALFIGFTPLLARVAAATVPSRGRADETSKLSFMDSTINVSEISLLEVRRAMIRFGEITLRMAQMTRMLFTEADPTERDKWHERIKHYENVTDRMEVEIVSYCMKLSTTKLTTSSSEHIRALLRIAGELERIADTYFQISRTIGRKNEAQLWFTPAQRRKLLELMDLVDAAADIMMKNLRTEMDKRVDVKAAKEMERQINEVRTFMRKEHIKRIDEGKDNLRSSTVYSELFNALEKTGNHIVNVSEALAGEV